MAIYCRYTREKEILGIVERGSVSMVVFFLETTNNITVAVRHLYCWFDVIIGRAILGLKMIVKIWVNLCRLKSSLPSS